MMLLLLLHDVVAAADDVLMVMMMLFLVLLVTTWQIQNNIILCVHAFHTSLYAHRYECIPDPKTIAMQV